MTEEQHARLLEACRPVMCIASSNPSGGPPIGPRSPQENANDAWQQLGREMGFVWDSARPISGESQRVFSAEPIEAAAEGGA